MEYLEEPQY